MRRFLVSPVAVLSLAVLLAAAPAQATERGTSLRSSSDTTIRTPETTGTGRTAAESPSTPATTGARPRSTGPGLGTGTQQNLSLNPLGGDKKLKKDLNDATMRNTSGEAHDQGQQTGQGLGAHNKDQLSGMTTLDEKSQESLKNATEKKEKLERHQRHCRDACKDGEYEGSSLSKTLGGSLGGGGFGSNAPGSNIFHSKTEEEKQAEEKAKAEAKAAKAKMSLAEKKKLCYEECMNDGSYIDVIGIFGDGKK